MQRFIPTNKNRNTHVLVTEYNWPIEEYLKGFAIVVYVNHMNDMHNIKMHIDDSTMIHCFVYQDKYASLETLELNQDAGGSPVVLIINRLGQFRDVYQKIHLLRQINAFVFFSGAESTACTDAQILASLGVHTGITLEPEAPLSDSILDLITYNFYSPRPHADIEPFATMEKYYDGESYVSPNLAKLIDPNRYIHVGKGCRIAFSKEELDNGNLIGEDISLLRDEKLQDLVFEKEHEWQKMFVDNHPCTYCPAFRVCMGYFAVQREKGRCKEVMTELLEAIEFKKSLNNNNKTERCQI